MPPKLRGGKRTGRVASPAAKLPVASEGEDSDTVGDNNDDHLEFENFVRSTLSKLVEGQQQLEARLAASIEFNSERIVVLEKAKMGLEMSVSALEGELSEVKDRLSKQGEEINKQERFARRNNFRVVGVTRSESENCAEKISNIFTTKFDWDSNPPRIERAHRDGRDNNGRPPHILVKLLSYQDKVRVMKEWRRALEGSQLHILNDLTLQDWQEKKPWKTEVKALYDKGIKLRFFAGKWRSSNGEAFHLSR